MMKIAESWLREWVNPDLDTEALSHQLTMLGHDYTVYPLAFDRDVIDLMTKHRQLMPECLGIKVGIHPFT